MTSGGTRGPASFSFGTTADLPDVPGIIGQARAEEAVRFAIGIRRYGYNLYALGTSGMGKHGFVRAFLERQAAGEKAPPDWCYVHDFAEGSMREKDLLGGKGANLAEMTNLGLPVPPGFTITTEAPAFS